MKTTDTSNRGRAIYRSVEAYLTKEFGKDHGYIISPGFLRAEQTLSNSKGKYSFDLKKNGNEIATEVKLDRNDLFVVEKLGLYLSLQDSTTIGKEVLQSYPNNTVFTSTALVPADLEVIYNGFSSLKIGNRVNIENLSNQVFRYVPETQQSSATTKSNTSLDDATYKPAPLIMLHGTMDIVYTVEFPTFATIAITTSVANTTTKLVLMPFGFLVKGAANKK